MTTRVAGELSLDDEVSTPTPRPPGAHSAPERIEVTQPYIPAIREQAPEFAKRPDARSGPASVGPVERLPLMSEIAAADPAAPEKPQGVQDGLTRPADFTPAAPPGPETAPVRQQPPGTQPRKPAQPPKKRSLARRVVRRIIGPDLLRKDPPKKK